LPENAICHGVSNLMIYKVQNKCSYKFFYTWFIKSLYFEILGFLIYVLSDILDANHLSYKLYSMYLSFTFLNLQIFKSLKHLCSNI